MRVPIYQLDAFASGLFRGNPAAVCPLDSWLPDETLQAIAAENNLAETAYYIPENGKYRIRWFSPTVEIALCGHATLASAAVILDVRKERSGSRVEFVCQKGELAVERHEDRLVLDFPSIPPSPVAKNTRLVEALGCDPQETLRSYGDVFVFRSEDEVRNLRPDMRKLSAVEHDTLIATAPGRDCDFVSRFFAPRFGIDEDPVTGSAHSVLIPYWSARLGKQKMFARQISPRGGELWCEDRGSRVGIGGKAVKYLEGFIEV